ncbi:MAG TPA: DUF4388 domain-containing protein [Thermoanaerobaculia bacterium]|nr:DUF4388 domain-containing protein [Thermoanaerobaculia bacterium]
MSEKPIFEGDLSRIQLPDVLSFVSMIRATGRLLVRQAHLERSVLWRDGDIVFAQSNSLDHTLGHFLLRNGKISEAQYDESRKKVSPQMRHGKVLVQMGVISPKELWWGVKNQVLEIIYSMFTWKDGMFAFYETLQDEAAAERIVVELNTQSVIMEGIRRIDESARIREKIPNLDIVFAKEAGAQPDFEGLDMSEAEIEIYNNIDGRLTVRGLVGKSELTEFEVTRILFQLLSARLIEVAEEEKTLQPVFLDVEDSPELLRIISTYNDMFRRLFEALATTVGDESARSIFTTVLQTAETDELWTGVFFDQYGRFDENMLIANISELPFERRKSALDEGLNTLLSVQLFEVSQHLDATGKVDVFRFISDQKALIEKPA